jgi:uncharacterized membrane protein
MRRMMSSANAKRAGVVGAWVIVAFVALAGAAAMSLDLGRLVLSAQRCQDVADSSALAAATQLPYEAPARAAALRTAQANATDGAGWPVECTNSDIVFVGPNGTIDGHTLGPWAHAVKVTVRGAGRVHLREGLRTDGRNAPPVGDRGPRADQGCTDRDDVDRGGHPPQLR